MGGGKSSSPWLKLTDRPAAEAWRQSCDSKLSQAAPCWLPSSLFWDQGRNGQECLDPAALPPKTHPQALPSTDRRVWLLRQHRDVVELQVQPGCQEHSPGFPLPGMKNEISRREGAECGSWARLGSARTLRLLCHACPSLPPFPGCALGSQIKQGEVMGSIREDFVRAWYPCAPSSAPQHAHTVTHHHPIPGEPAGDSRLGNGFFFFFLDFSLWYGITPCFVCCCLTEPTDRREDSHLLGQESCW